MLSGKVVARAFRDYCLVDAALNAMITSRAFRFPFPEVSRDGPLTTKADNTAEV